MGSCLAHARLPFPRLLEPPPDKQATTMQDHTFERARKAGFDNDRRPRLTKVRNIRKESNEAKNAPWSNTPGPTVSPSKDTTARPRPVEPRPRRLTGGGVVIALALRFCEPLAFIENSIRSCGRPLSHAEDAGSSASAKVQNACMFPAATRGSVVGL